MLPLATATLPFPHSCPGLGLMASSCPALQPCELTLRSASQAINTLTELVQGPCVNNQVCIMQLGIVDTINYILSAPFEYVDKQGTNLVWELRSATVVLILVIPALVPLCAVCCAVVVCCAGRCLVS